VTFEILPNLLPPNRRIPGLASLNTAQGFGSRP